MSDMFDLDTTLDPNAGSNHARPSIGRGLYVLKDYYPKDTTKQGGIIVAELVVVTPPQGSALKPGEMVSLAWCVSKVGHAGKYERARAGKFVCALLGLPDGTNAGPYSKKLCGETKPGTGVCIVITGAPNGEYTNYTFDHVPNQTGDKIKAMRERVIQMDAAAQYTPAPPKSEPPPRTDVPHAASSGVDFAAMLGGSTEKKAAGAALPTPAMFGNDIPF